MKYIVAVSGGVDSVALLDMLVRKKRNQQADDSSSKVETIDEIVVAHVDHGIRQVSSEDARFVQALSKLYQVPYRQTALRLGSTASEEQAREARYDFLYELAGKHDAVIATAHHQDDMIGSIAINLQRGTGWRGLAVLNRPGLVRPLLGWDKKKIYAYAMERGLEWVEDETNNSPVYLRNRLRSGVVTLDSSSAKAVVGLRQHQLQLAREIDDEVGRIEQLFADDRQPYSLVDSGVAVELLRWHVENLTSYRPSIEQAQRLLLAVKTAKPGTAHDIANGVRARFSARSFVVDNPR